MSKPWKLPVDREPSESEEQRDFVRWFRRQYPATLIYAIPNGGRRGKREAQSLVCEGVTAGIPDLHVPEWDLFIEMKRQKTWNWTPGQPEMRDHLVSIGKSYIKANGSAKAQVAVQGWVATNSLCEWEKKTPVPTRDTIDPRPGRQA